MTRIGRDKSRHIVRIPGSSGGQLVLSWASSTDTGHRRSANEDSVLADSPIFAVADGMGGHAAGDLASAAVVNRLSEAREGEFAELGRLIEALEAATADIDRVADDNALGVGTTVTGAALVMLNDVASFAVFNIGDSRVYRFYDGELSQITVDHSVVQELVDSGIIHPDDAEFHPDSNVITRAVGFNASPHPDYWMLAAVPGMRLLLCSDGLTKEVGRERLRLHLAAGMSPEDTVAALMDAALAAGGRDNVSLIIVDVLEAPGADPHDTAPLR
ncbi:MAG: protein phosphatase 2C domain-containing protein [Actinomycetota bacterium]|nr:protein phosphatase 2C domain-containing protein [Actinomycetota bacterium]